MSSRLTPTNDLGAPPSQAPDIARIETRHADSERNASRRGTRGSQESIAIVGQSARYAGAANLDEYWANLRAGRDCIVEVPASRWDVGRYFDPHPASGKTYSKWLGALDDIDAFDPTFFNIAPTEAEMMDPQHRLFLQEAYRAFEDAGYTRDALSNRSCGVYLGIMHNEYGLILQKELGDRAVSMLTSSSFSIAAARIAYYLNLKGPAIAIDTACSSSLVALHMACQALRNGEIEMALVGGVTLYLMAETYVGMSKVGMLSADGRCKPFDSQADGMVPGEGVGAVVLKRLSDAEAAQDTIYGVVVASAVNQDGKTNGITAPNLDAQVQLIRGLYRDCDLHPESIDYVEMHGTGTKLGDPIELRALATVFAERTARTQICPIGSVKGNIGHASAAAGLAGLHKVLLALRHQSLPPSIHFSAPNPLFNFEASPFFVNTELRPWPSHADRPRRAAISSFGMSGTNAHVLIDEYRSPPRSLAPVHDEVAIVLSARDPERLRERARQLLDACAAHSWSDADLVRIAYTLQVCRDAMDARAAFTVKSVEQLRTILLGIVAGAQADHKGVYFGSAKHNRDFVGAFARNPDFKEVVNKWLRRRKYTELINLWVRGFSLQWQRLYGEWRPQRLSLPTYPFARERYWVSALPDDRPRTRAATPAGQVADDAPLVFEEQWIEQSLEAPPIGMLHTVVVVLSSRKHRQAVIDLLRFLSPHANAVVICVADTMRTLDAHDYEVSNAAQEFRDTFALVAQRHGRIDGVLYLVALEDRDSLLAPEKMMPFIQGLAAANASERVVLCADAATVLHRCYADAWVALALSLRLTLPGIRFAVQRAEGETSPNDMLRLQTQLARAFEELTAQNFDSALYRQGRRFVRRIVQSEATPIASLIRPRGNYLITGGAGGIGLGLAKHLASQGAAHIVLLGRSAVSAQRERIAGIGDARVRYIQADVCDASMLADALRETLTEIGDLHGVIHAAGVAAEGDVLSNTAEQFARVLAPKIAGTLALDRALAKVVKTPLDFLCFFSSSAALLGDFGSGDYALGNRFLLAYAAQRHEFDGIAAARKTFAICWPWWEGGGMSTRADAAQLYLQSSGQRSLKTGEALVLFERLLGQPGTHRLVLCGQRERIERFLHGHATERSTQIPASSSESPQDGHINVAALELDECVEADLKRFASALLKLPRERLDRDENLAQFGFDSIGLTELARRLSAYYSLTITPAAFFNYPTLAKFARYLASEYRAPLQSFYRDAGRSPAPSVAPTTNLGSADAARSASSAMPIAIIGMSGRFAESRTIEEFWSVLAEGRDAVAEIPMERFDWRAEFADKKTAAGGSICKWLGAVPGVQEFDPLFFEISPHEAELMDPRQRLLLQESWRALEDAGMGAVHLARQRVGMFVGAEQGDYQLLHSQTEHITANHDAILAARLAYFLNLSGPTLTLNTACSSGLVAAHQAMLSLKAGECDVAIVAAVNLLLTPQPFIAMSEAGMLSAEGRCKTFAADADGMVPGEAVVALVLKPLVRAQAEGDPIHAVIRGSAINYDGKTNGLTAPSGIAQANLIRDAHAKAQVDARCIEYVVTHGTGTKLGDPIEVNALQDAFTSSAVGTSCALTSTKSNVGHTLAASGLVNVVTLVQAMRRECIPPSLHCDALNPYIEWRGPLFVNRAPRAWPRRSEPRYGAVSAFGMSGTNAHLVLSSYESNPTHVVAPTHFLLAVSAKTAAAHSERERELANFLQSTRIGPQELLSLSLTLLSGRHHFAHRSAIVVSDVGQAIHLWSHSGDPRRIQGTVASDFRESRALREQGEQLCRAKEASTGDSILRALAELYVQGYAFDWTQLFPEGTPRMHLPTYPFARERYWVGPGKLPRSVPGLLRDISTRDERRYVATLRGDESVLIDHRVHGERLMPAVMYLEMVRAAMALSTSTSTSTSAMAQLRLRNVVWSQPLIVRDSCDLNVTLHETAQGQFQFAIFRDHAGERVTHCTGEVATIAAVAPARDLDAARANCTTNYDASRCYQAFAALGIDYGPTYRTVRGMMVGKDAYARRMVVATLEAPAALESHARRFVLDPGIFDGGWQAAIGCNFDEPNQHASAPLPFALDELTIFAPPSEGSTAVLRESSTGAVRKFDIDFCDARGTVNVAVRGLSVRHAHTNVAPSARENGKAIALTAIPSWRAMTEAPVEPWPSKANSIVVIGGTAEQRTSIQARYPNAHWVHEGAAVDDYAEALRRCGSIDHVFWIAPEAVSSSAIDALVIEEQAFGVLACFRWLKALQRLGYAERALGLTIITAQALGVLTSELNDPTHAGIHGLFGSIAKEYPRWRLRIVDLAEREWPFADVLKLVADPHGNTYAWRAGQWWRQRLLQCALPEAQLPQFRERGVYVIVGGAGGIGQALSEYLIRRYRAQLIWLGRREPTAAIESALERLAALGPRPQYLVADATDGASLALAQENIRAAHEVVHGVVHATLELADGSFATMDESQFARTLASKVDSVVNSARVFAASTLDFVLFFSALQSFGKAAGQCNYAAGCVFLDAFAQRLSRERSYPIKVINWGYWGTVGVVAAAHYRERMQSLGIESIDPAEAMVLIEALLAAPLSQVAYVKSTQRNLFADAGFACDEQAVIVAMATRQASLALSSASGFLENAPQVAACVTDANARIARIVSGQLRRHGFLSAASSIAPSQRRWLQQSVRMLNAAAFVEEETWNDSLAEWTRYVAAQRTDRYIGAQLQLADRCLHVLPEVLSGRMSANEALFPNASLKWVEGVYRHNALAARFNELVAELSLAFIDAVRAHDPPARFRILEVGAGTGATTAAVLERLGDRHAYIDEYRYTDVSQVFLDNAGAQYGQYPFLTTALLDIEQPLSTDALGAFDIVIAANVLHACADVREALANAKSALKRGGLLLLNELSEPNWFAHLTFGLLDGWWKRKRSAQRDTLRDPGWPGLHSEAWRAALMDAGFTAIQFPARDGHFAGQQVIAALSDGIIVRRSVRQGDAPEAATAASQSHMTPSVADHSLRERVRAHLKGVLGQALKLPPERIDGAESFQRYGMDSLLVVRLTNALRESFPGISNTVFFEYHTLNTLSDFLLEHEYEAAARLDAPCMDHEAAPTVNVPMRAVADAQRGDPAPQPVERWVQDVAVIGMSGRFPLANSVEEFWENLRVGRNCIREIPKDRWDWRAYYSAEKGSEQTIYSKWGGFLDEIDKFDPLFFRISPREAARLDPQERLFLQEAYACIEDAGYTPATLSPRKRVGVFVGVMNSTYQRYSTYWSIPNRVSYLFDFYGPSLAVDSACSSSLTAIHLALESIYSGSCDCALAGGVNLIVDPIQYRTLSGMTMLSAGDRCRAFGDQADGFVDGEGVGVVALKPLQRALQDGDRIYGVIKGSMVNAGGHTHGYSVPNPNAQAQVIVEALDRARVDARAVTYIEAHGTGTALGDPIEVAGLTRAFRQRTADRQYCAIGSVKSNIGHLEAAAGVAGLIKVLLQFRHKTLAPTLHAQTPNPDIDFASTPFVLQQTLAEWTRPRITVRGALSEVPRIAGISSFGAGGANAHLIVEEFDELNTAEARPAPGERLIVLSAQTPEALRARSARLHTALRTALTDIDLDRIAYTLQVGREPLDYRLAFKTDSPAKLLEQLAALANDTPLPDVYRGVKSRDGETLAFLSTEDCSTLVNGWIAQGAYEKLLSAWTKGIDVDWLRLYGGRVPRRVSLPTYPFARERHWLDATARAAATSDREMLHPLVHKNTSNFSEQRFSSRFDGHEFFLSDHLLGEHKILPGVCYLEMARAAFQQASGVASQPVRLSGISWLKPAVVDSALELHIALVPRGDARAADFQIYSDPVSDQGAVRTIHAEGSIESVAANVDRAETLNLGAIAAECTQPVDPQSLYDSFAALGVRYGPSFRALHRLNVGMGGERALAEVRLPEEEDARFTLHPTLLDAAFQACAGFALTSDRERSLALPFALEAVTIFAPLPAALSVYVQRRTNRPDAQVFDIDLCAPSGELCVRLEGFLARADTAEATSTGAGTVDNAAQPVTATLMAAAWCEVAPPTALLTPEPHEKVLIVGGTLAQVSALFARYPTAQAITHRHTERIDTIATRIAHFGPLDHVLWIAPASLANTVSGGAIVAEQEQGVISCLRVIHALLRTGYEHRELGFTAITINGLYIPGKDAHIPVHASVHGLIGALAAEYPNWKVRAIDAEPETPIAQLLTTPCDAHANAWVHRGSAWFRQQYGAVATATQRSSKFKEGGVYVLIGGAGGIGIALTEYLLRRYQARIVWIGRRPQDERIAEQLQRLAQFGPAPIYLEADATDCAELAAACAKTTAHFGCIHGVVHAAFAPLDRGLPGMDEDRFRQGLLTKVGVCVALAQVFADAQLDFVLFMSSLQSFLKRPGQSNYAAGCVFKDAFASYLSERGSHAVRTVNWGYWGSVGAAATPELRRRMAGLGLASIEAADAMAVIEQLLTGPHGQLGFFKTVDASVAQGFLALNRDVPLLKKEMSPPPAVVNKTSSVERVRQAVVTSLSEALHIAATQIDATKSFADYGLDSIVGVHLSRAISKRLSISLPSSSLFSNATVNDLTAHILKKFAGQLVAEPARAPIEPLQEPTPTRTQSSNRFSAGSAPKSTAPESIVTSDAQPVKVADDVAIIGVSGRFPNARSLEEFWRKLASGADLIDEVPADRWSLDEFYEPDVERAVRAGKSYSKWGGFIPGARELDFDFFTADTLPYSLHTRHLLEVTWNAVESAGYSASSLPKAHRSNIGVYIGGISGTSGLSIGAIATNVAIYFGCRGPCIAVDAMSASSMTALHMGCEAIRRGECDVAIVGGVSLLSEEKFRMHSSFKTLSPSRDGRSYQPGDGTQLAECVGVLVLKRLSHAIAARDPIRAVIRFSQTCHLGGFEGKAVPDVDFLVQSIGEKLRAANIDPRSISYVETAGTGIRIGDQLELAFLTRLFAETKATEFCRIGTVKSYMGHAEAASGISQVIKTVLQFDHGQLLPLRGHERLDSEYDFRGTAFAVQRQVEAWPRVPPENGNRAQPRRAMVNSAGIGGTFSNVVLEEFAAAPLAIATQAPRLLVLSAMNPQSLAIAIRQLRAYVAEHAGMDLDGFAYTLQFGREALAERVAVVVEDSADIPAALKACLSIVEGGEIGSRRVWRGCVVRKREALDVQCNAATAHLHDVAEAWVTGASIEWEKLYAAPPQRLVLPGYPFAQLPHPNGQQLAY